MNFGFFDFFSNSGLAYSPGQEIGYASGVCNVKNEEKDRGPDLGYGNYILELEHDSVCTPMNKQHHVNENKNDSEYRTPKESTSGLWCPECRTKFSEESQVISHARTVHGDRSRKTLYNPDSSRKQKLPNSEDAGGKQTSMLSSLKTELCKDPFPFQCITCNDKFQAKAELLVHHNQINAVQMFHLQSWVHVSICPKATRKIP